MTPDDLCRSNFNQFLLSAIVNGLSSLETIPEAVLDGCLGPDHLLSSVLLSCFYTIPKHAATTLASSFFQASIIQGKHDIVAQLLEKRLAVANDNVIFIQGMRRITPFEWAAMQKDEILLELLLSYGADPNKTYCQGEGTIKRYDRALLKLIGPSYYGGSITYGPSAAAVRKLFEAGAEVCPGIGPSLKHVDEAVASCIISQILPSQHADFFPNEFWTSVILCGGDIQAADLVNQVVLDCRERHNGQCLLRFQEQVDWGLVAAASKGRVDTFLAISPHSSHSSSLDATLLSASIRGKQPAIIDFVMLRKPDINPRPHTLQPHNPYKPHNPLMGVADDETSPLAETIRTGNTEFVDLFTQANIFESLHEGGRLEVALSAAVETGNAELVVRMLGSCPDLESLSIKHILDQAIDNGQEGLALVLIGRGASVYSGRRFGTIMPYSIPPVLRAIENGNLLIARKLVEIGDMGEYYRDNSRALQVLCRRQGCSIDPLLTKDFLSSFDCNFRYEVDDIRADCLRSYLSQSAEETAQQFPETISAALIEEGLDLILTSKLATVPLLTVCLASAISQNNATLARELIKRGADAADEMVWTCAVRWNPDLLPLLLDGMNHQRSVIPTGLRTEVLKRAIMQGPSRADVVSLLITSGSVDIFDTGDGNGLERSTPLGVAIRKTELFPKFGYDIVRLLLEHGCDPNGIVRFNTNNAGNAPNTNQTAILEAISVGNQELVELLIEYGAHVNTEMRHLVRRTPLQKAAEEGDLEMVQLLLSHKADVSAEPCIALGGTALQFAAISGNCNIAAELLSHGALLHMPPSSIGGRWPIEGAAEHGRVDMIQFLWTANEETLFLYDGDTGFQEKNFKKAMRLAGENGHIGCRDLIAELANLPITATDVPPVVSPMYISWPPLK
jgi:ankyrin repeat protein